MKLNALTVSVTVLGLVFSGQGFGLKPAQSKETPLALATQISSNRANEISGVLNRNSLRISFVARAESPSRVVTEVNVGGNVLDAEVDLAAQTAVLDGHGLTLSIEQIEALIVVGTDLERYLDPDHRQPLPHEDMLYRVLSVYTLGLAGNRMGHLEVALGRSICPPTDWIGPFAECGEPAASTEPEFPVSCNGLLDCFVPNPDHGICYLRGDGVSDGCSCAHYEVSHDEWYWPNGWPFDHCYCMEILGAGCNLDSECRGRGGAKCGGDTAGLDCLLGGSNGEGIYTIDFAAHDRCCDLHENLYCAGPWCANEALAAVDDCLSGTGNCLDGCCRNDADCLACERCELRDEFDFAKGSHCVPLSCTGCNECTGFHECTRYECCTGSDCDDGNECTSDECRSHSCYHVPVDCYFDGYECTLIAPCARCVNGCCEFGTACVDHSDCDDNNYCTTNWCINGCCEFIPNCRSDDVCSLITCHRCGSDGCCEPDPVCTSYLDCNDHDNCTLDECVNGCCRHVAECTSPSDCDDGDDNTPDQCVNGCCQHIPDCTSVADCDDGNNCTADNCTGGICTNAPLFSCGDGSCDSACGENCSSCPQDCHRCSDGCCDASHGETRCTCAQDCALEGTDCNANGVPDDCDLADGLPDCNHNDLPDECDIVGPLQRLIEQPTWGVPTSLGTQPDARNGTEVAFSMGVVSDAATAYEIRVNDIPVTHIEVLRTGVCEVYSPPPVGVGAEVFNAALAAGGGELVLTVNPLIANNCATRATFVQIDYDLAPHSTDCNGDAVPDECDIAAGTSHDCNGNGAPDECDISGNNLLLNAGAELGDIFGWTPSPRFAVRSGSPGPHRGSFYFFAGAVAEASITQTIDLVASGFAPAELDSGVLTASVGGYQRSLLQAPADEGQITVDYLDGAQSVLESFVGPVKTNTGSWDLVEDVRKVRTGTRFVRFTFNSTRRTGTSNDGYLDSAFVVLTDGAGLSQDCNNNGIPDECDIAGGTSGDANGNGVPDECEGACCSQGDGACTILTESECVASGGVYAGDDTTCETSPCHGACCLNDGSCQELTEQVCVNASGASNCCKAHMEPSCTDAVCEACVCGVDSLCCWEEWYPECADIAYGACASDCQAGCYPPPPGVWLGRGTACGGTVCPDKCGDGVCGSTENCCECSADCGLCCGNGVCDIHCGETCHTCQTDCPAICGDGCCNAAETPCDCPQDCQPTGNDCNTNGTPDECDIAGGTSADCNANAVPDECDIVDPPPLTLNENPTWGVPTNLGSQPEARTGTPVVFSMSLPNAISATYLIQVNGTHVAQMYVAGTGTCGVLTSGGTGMAAEIFNTALAAGDGELVLTVTPVPMNTCIGAAPAFKIEYQPVVFSNDCNANSAPDECDIAGGTSPDCNSNGVPDECDVLISTVPSGHALAFDGVAAHVLIPSTPELRPTNNFTIEAWVNLNSVGTAESIFRHDDNGGGDDAYYLLVMDTGVLRFGASNANGGVAQSVFSTQTLSIGHWHHVAGVYDNSVLKVYVDGQETSKPADDDVRYQAFANVNIGRRGGTGSPNTAFLDGTLDEIRFWNVPRSQAEIQAMMTMPLTGTEPGLVGYWRFDEGVGGFADDSADGHDGTLVNGPAWIDAPTMSFSSDCNANGVPDECELADHDVNGNGVIDTCEHVAGGDFDGNGVVDLADQEYLVDCEGGPGSPPTPADANAADLCLQAFDADGDGDIDLEDFAEFQSGFMGPGSP